MRVLIAEHDSIQRSRLVRTVKRWGYDVVSCEDGAQALRLLRQENPPKLALLSWKLPKVVGLQICRKVRKFDQGPYMYLVVLGPMDDKGYYAKALRAGADDYMSNSFTTDELRARLQVGSRIVILQENFLAALHQSEFRAAHDPLTGLWNQTAILDFLQREIDRSHRNKSPLSLIIADLDLFKGINDSLGHLVGDEVLREISKRIQSSIRSYDYAGRYGGDEFVIIMPGCDRDAAYSRAESLRTSISEPPISTTEGDILCTISIGLAVMNVADFLDSKAFLKAADQALYRAKSSGRNQVSLVQDS